MPWGSWLGPADIVTLKLQLDGWSRGQSVNLGMHLYTEDPLGASLQHPDGLVPDGPDDYIQFVVLGPSQRALPLSRNRLPSPVAGAAINAYDGDQVSFVSQGAGSYLLRFIRNKPYMMLAQLEFVGDPGS